MQKKKKKKNLADTTAAGFSMGISLRAFPLEGPKALIPTVINL